MSGKHIESWNMVSLDESLQGNELIWTSLQRNIVGSLLFAKESCDFPIMSGRIRKVLLYCSGLEDGLMDSWKSKPTPEQTKCTVVFHFVTICLTSILQKPYTFLKNVFCATICLVIPSLLFPPPAIQHLLTTGVPGAHCHPSEWFPLNFSPTGVPWMSSLCQVMMRWL